MGLISRGSSRTYRSLNTISSWINDSQFKLVNIEEKFKKLTENETTQPTNSSRNIQIPKSTAKSRAETRSSYRSTTSKIERRKDKKIALLAKLKSDAEYYGSKKLKKNNFKEPLILPASCAQADIALYKLAIKKQQKKKKKKKKKKKS